MSMIAAIYIRKSREDKDKPSQRLNVQREQLPAYATTQGWTPAIYDDGHASAARGKAENLPERARLEADIRAGKINIILTIELSRLSRDESLQDFIQILTLCADHRVRLATMSRILDPAQHSDWMLLLMEGGFSSVEMKVLQARMKEGRNEARRAGKFLGGVCPPPYQYDKSIGKPIVDELQLQQMQQIWTLAETESARAISSKTGRAEIFIRRALADDRLLFYQALRINETTGETIPCDWQPVMDAAQAKRIKTCRSMRGHKINAPRREFASLLSNLQLIYCGYCGRTVKTWTNTRARTDGTVINYYGCQTKDTRKKCTSARLIAQDVLDFAITTNVFNTLGGLEELKALWEGQQAQINSGEALQTVIQEIKKAEEKKARLVQAITNGVMEFADAKPAMSEIKNTIEQLEQQRITMQTMIANPPQWDALTITKAEFKAQPVTTQREFLKHVIERIDLYNMHAIITYKFPRNENGTATAKVNLPEMHRGKRLDK